MEVVQFLVCLCVCSSVNASAATCTYLVYTLNVRCQAFCGIQHMHSVDFDENGLCSIVFVTFTDLLVSSLFDQLSIDSDNFFQKRLVCTTSNNS